MVGPHARTKVLLDGLGVVVALAGTTIAMWSFAHARLAWGAYNVVLALVALSVVVAVRARGE